MIFKKWHVRKDVHENYPRCAAGASGRSFRHCQHITGIESKDYVEDLRIMRKRIIGPLPLKGGEKNWLDLEQLAKVELTSESPDFPVEAALGLRGHGRGWRAAEVGEQLIRLVFVTPVRLRRIRLELVEQEKARTHQFALRWAGSRSPPPVEIVRQQWTFSPPGTTREVEDYGVDLASVGVLELAIRPDLGAADAIASLESWQIA
jgi:hypothetical protein